MNKNSINPCAFRIVLFLFFIFLFITACDKSDETPKNGKLRILLTDKPYPVENIKNALVSLYKIELRAKKNNSDGNMGNGNPFIIVMNESKEFNLVDLQNGVTEELAMVEIPAGTYDLVRLHMRDASIELNDGKLYGLKIPSGSSSGLKIFIKPEIVVDGGLTSELLLDINLNRSLVMKGNPNNIEGFNFNPVIRAVNTSTTGRIAGFITEDTEEAIKGALVNIKVEEEVINSTNTDETGYYAFIGVQQGTYVLSIFKENYVAVQIEEVEVKAGNKTEVNVQLTESQE